MPPSTSWHSFRAFYSMGCWAEVHLYGPLVPARLNDLTGGKTELSLTGKLMCTPPGYGAPDWHYLECWQFQIISWAELLFRFQSVISNFCAMFQVLFSEGYFGEFCHLLVVNQSCLKNFFLGSKSWSSKAPNLHYIKGVRHSSTVLSNV